LGLIKKKLIFLIFLFSTSTFSEEIECQGAVIRILNKITTEKVFYTIPLSQTLELNNTNIVVHRCLKIDQNGKNDEIALISHETISDKKNFFGWIFKSSQYLNIPINPVYDVKLQECLIKDPLFLKDRESI